MVSATSAAPGINQGSWSDEETEQLKKFAEQSRSVGASGEIEWDWVVRQWGSGRTRFVVFFFFLVSAMVEWKLICGIDLQASDSDQGYRARFERELVARSEAAQGQRRGA